MMEGDNLRARASRREILRLSGAGFGSVALAALLADQTSGAHRTADSPAPRGPHLAARARRVIFLFMAGGPSQVDTFDPKPRLLRDNGKASPKAYLGQTRKLLASPWKFRKHGESGLDVSELFPHIGSCADSLCVIRSMVGDDVNHPGGCLLMNTGERVATRPSLGAWVTYGLGTENQDLPGFIAIGPGPLIEGARQYGAAFLPAAYQGTFVSDLRNPIRNLKNLRVSQERQRKELDSLGRLNEMYLEGRPDDSRLRRGSNRSSLLFACSERHPTPSTSTARARRPGGCTGSIKRPPTSSAASACWRAGWWNEALGSCSSTTPAAASSPGISTAI